MNGQIKDVLNNYVKQTTCERGPQNYLKELLGDFNESISAVLIALAYDKADGVDTALERAAESLRALAACANRTAELVDNTLDLLRD